MAIGGKNAKLAEAGPSLVPESCLSRARVWRWPRSLWEALLNFNVGSDLLV